MNNLKEYNKSGEFFFKRAEVLSGKVVSFITRH